VLRGPLRRRADPRSSAGLTTVEEALGRDRNVWSNIFDGKENLPWHRVNQRL